MNTKVSVKEKICYGIGSGGGNIITQILGTFLTAYYTDSVGIAAAAVGTMMLVARLLDGISDVMMGGIVDKTRTKWGKARPWILISAPVICIGLILTFNVPGSLSSSAKLIYAYITYVFLNCIAFTAYMISHTALLSRVTLDVNDRQSMTSINQIVNNVVQLIVTGFTIKFVTAVGWRSVSIVYGLLTALMLLICFWGVREHLDMDAETEEVKVEPVPLKEAVPAILKNKYFYLVAALFILTLILCKVIFTGSGAGTPSDDSMTFGAAVELAVAMPLSWLPLISDYTREAKEPVKATAVSAVTYGIVSCWMYVIGMGAAIITGEYDIAQIMLKAGLGILGLLIIVFSTVTTTFLDAYSAGISSETVVSRWNGKHVAIVVTVIGTAAAIVYPMDNITDFLYLIGSVFAPMIAIQIADFFLLKQDKSSQAVHMPNMIIWVIGFVVYRILMNVDMPVGNTLPDMVITIILCLIAGKLIPEKNQKE